MKKILGAFGIKPNGSPTTFQGQYGDLLKMIVVVASVAYALGGATSELRGTPARVKEVEREIVALKAVLPSIDARLARIEGALIRR